MGFGERQPIVAFDSFRKTHRTSLSDPKESIEAVLAVIRRRFSDARQF